MAGAGKIFDVAIVGAGLAGMTCALAFGPPGNRSRLRTVLIGAPQAGHTADLRALAITRSSRRMFEAMGLWEDMAPLAEPLREIVVNDARPGEGESPALLHWTYEETGEPSAHFIESHLVQRLLGAALSQSEHVQVVAADLLHGEHHKGRVEITTTQGERLQARLLIAADGRESRARASAGIGVRRKGYGQMGIVATLQHALPHGGRAYERFMPAGPFALLPLTGKRSSIVWTEEQETARLILAQGQELFLQELRKRVSPELGEIEVVAGPQAHDLSILLAETPIRNRTALIGDAAHVIHPLAGLGFNLALRDIAALVEVVMEKARLGLDIGSEGSLEPFARRRRLDTMMNTAVTDGLNRLFSNDIAPVKLARDLGLRIVDRLPMLKQFLMQEAAGLTGDLPRLMRGEAV
jgi:2-octaprenyl-6-methoxyphenol hydroxylase